MVFSSLLFLFRFLPIVLFIYVITPKKFKNFVLFLASLIFYAWGEPKYVVLMIFSTVVDFVHGNLVYRYKEKGNLKAAKCFVASSAIINLGLLGYFKGGTIRSGNEYRNRQAEYQRLHPTRDSKRQGVQDRHCRELHPRYPQTR